MEPPSLTPEFDPYPHLTLKEVRHGLAVLAVVVLSFLGVEGRYVNAALLVQWRGSIKRVDVAPAT